MTHKNSVVIFLTSDTYAASLTSAASETSRHSWFGHYFCSNLYGHAPRGRFHIEYIKVLIFVICLVFMSGDAPYNFFQVIQNKV